VPVGKDQGMVAAEIIFYIVYGKLPQSAHSIERDHLSL